MISVLKRDVDDFSIFKGLLLSISGDVATSNPVVNVEFNVASVVRTGIGVYRITAKQSTFFGVPIGVNSIVTISHTIQPTAISEAHFVRLVRVNTITFDIEVTEMTVGGGNKLEVNPYDIISGDGVDTSFLLQLGLGRLPPE